MKPQHTQFTLRVIGTHKQYIETTFTEAEARENVARIHLSQTGHDPTSPGFEEKVAELAQNGLKLVYIR